MRLPRVLGVLGIVLLVVSPFLPLLPLIIGYFRFSGFDASGLHRALTMFTLGMCYAAAVQSLTIAHHFRRPLLDPNSRWGVLGPRKTPKTRLWGLMLWIALEAPTFAFFAQAYREWQRSLAKHHTETVQMADGMESFWSNQQAKEVAEAVRWEKLAAECRAKDARGESWTKRSWADQAKSHDGVAAMYRGMAAQSAAFLLKTRREWAPLRRSAAEAR